LGLATADHRVPSQCSIRVRLRYSPTAVQFEDAEQATPLRLASEDGLRIFAADQVLPFQCTTRPPVSELPTAVQFETFLHATARRVFTVNGFVLGFGLLTFNHLDPFQCSISVEKPTAPDWK